MSSAPEFFSFEDLLFLFVAVIRADVILLDIFNSLGLPTFTTVSMVFELLGATFGVAMLKAHGNGVEILEMMNTDKALSMIFAIFVSVGIAFTVGYFVQYVSHLAFSFNYKRRLWCKAGLFGGTSPL